MAVSTLYRRVRRTAPALRALLVVSLVESVGRGVFLSGNIVFFTRYTGLSAHAVALGLSLAGLSGFVASIAFGRVADRRGPRGVLITLLLLQAAGFTAYPLIHTATAYYLLVAAVGLLEWGVQPTKGALIGDIAGPDDRVRVQAAMRTVFNVGFSAGSALSTAVVFGRSALLAIPLVTAALMAAAAFLALRLPASTRRAPAPSDRRGPTAVRDRWFLGLVAVSVVQASHAPLLMVALPLWILRDGRVAPSLIPATLIVNTVLVVLFQLRASRGAETVGGATHVARRSGWWLAGSCALAACLTAPAPAIVVAAGVLIVVLGLSLAEMTQSAAGWGLAYALAPEHAQGEYLGTFGLHLAVQGMLGPALLAGIVTSWGAAGWLTIGVAVLASTFLVKPMANACARATLSVNPRS